MSHSATHAAAAFDLATLARALETSDVETIVALSRRIGAQVIAEGIETDVQLEALRQLGCVAGQGYYFAPALPPDAARRLLEEGRRWGVEQAAPWQAGLPQ